MFVGLSRPTGRGRGGERVGDVYYTTVSHCQQVDGTLNISETYLPPLATSRENMASNSEWIMEKTRTFQIVLPGR